MNILDAFDLAVSGFFIGQAIGRWGNFFNQEAFGSLTSHGMMSNGVADYIADHRISFDLGTVHRADVEEYLTSNGIFVHPTFLYESIWCLLGFILLHFLGKHRKFKGQLALTYGVWYGTGRAFIEQLRTDSLYLGQLKVSQWLSGVLAIVCAILLIYNFYKLKQIKVNKTYTAMFNDIDPASIKGVAYYDGESSEVADDISVQAEAEADTDEKSAEETVTDKEPDESAAPTEPEQQGQQPQKNEEDGE